MMLTPDEYNKNYLERHRKREERVIRAGVKCPRCGKEMLYNSNTILLSDPPQRQIHCPNCEFFTTIFC